MKKKIISVLLVATLALSGCGGANEITGDTNTNQADDNNTVAGDTEADLLNGEAPSVAIIVNAEGETTYVYQLDDGDYMDREVRRFTYDGAGKWTDETGEVWDLVSVEVSEDSYEDDSQTDGNGTVEKEPGHYSFQAYVVPEYMREVYGDAMCEAYRRFVDAIVEGRDDFECPDQNTYDWVMGQFPYVCFPVVAKCVQISTEPVEGGVAHFEYTIPVEEFQQKLEAFETEIVEILNSTLEDDYDDIEKMLALYKYMSDHYTYDDDLYSRIQTDFEAEVSGYRALQEKKGICQELSVLYSYLLLQVGIDATVMKGVGVTNEPHQWSYVRLNGKNYHVDPTFVVCDKDNLKYFMMTDEQRAACDGFEKENFQFISYYVVETGYPMPEAVDETYKDLWNGSFLSFDKDSNVLHYYQFDDGEGNYGEREFVY